MAFSFLGNLSFQFTARETVEEIWSGFKLEFASNPIVSIKGQKNDEAGILRCKDFCDRKIGCAYFATIIDEEANLEGIM